MPSRRLADSKRAYLPTYLPTYLRGTVGTGLHLVSFDMTPEFHTSSDTQPFAVPMVSASTMVATQLQIQPDKTQVPYRCVFALNWGFGRKTEGCPYCVMDIVFMIGSRAECIHACMHVYPSTPCLDGPSGGLGVRERPL